MNKPQKLVWDIPTRIFHWLLVVGFALQWLTGKYLDDAIDWHFTIGYCMLGLVIFRLVWGFVGSTYARFSQFVASPTTTFEYSKTVFDKNAKPYAGHNPLGGWSVLIILLVVAAQAISGLFVNDEIFSEGPYRSLASSAVIEVMEFIHFNVFDVLLALVALHVAAVLFYQIYKRQPILIAMFTGKKPSESDAIPSSQLLKGIIIACLVAGLVYVLVAVLPPEPEFYY